MYHHLMNDDEIRGNGRRKAIRGTFMVGAISPSRSSWWSWLKVPSGWASLTIPKKS